MSVSRRRLVEEVQSDVGRFVDMRVQWIAQDRRGQPDPNGEIITDVGGRWDALTKKWSGAGETLREFGLHRGQLPAARFLAAWMAAKAQGATFVDRGAPVYSLLLDGGRRGGKTDLGTKAAVTYPILRPRTWSWMISETLEKTGEYAEVVRELLPKGWYRYLGAPHYTFTLKNGSVIWMRSAHEPDRLKKGRCDIAAFNEAQLIAEKAFTVVRGSIADSGGLVILMANPPENAIGFWLERFRDQAIAGRRAAREFFLDARLNPHVDRAALESMRFEVDERTYEREVMGVWLPRADVAFHAWSDGPDGNVQPMPRLGEVTKAFLKRRLRRDVDNVVGIDLQRNPYPCGVGLRFFNDPTDPTGDPLCWYESAIIVENGDEEMLHHELVAAGYDPKRTALVLDASASWQGVDRKKRTPAFDIFKRLGWLHLFKPDDRYEKNPPIMERVKCANGLYKNAAGKRRVFSSPELVELNHAIKEWENRDGVPFRKSKHAHLCDAATYPLWRFFPRAVKVRPWRAEGPPRARGGTMPQFKPGADFDYR